MIDNDHPSVPRKFSLTNSVIKVEGESFIAHAIGYFDDKAAFPQRFIGTSIRDLSDHQKIFSSFPEIWGHYALVIESKKGEATYLATDPLGSFPIYYMETSEGWKWSFQLKGILPYLSSNEIDWEGVDEIFLYRWLMEDRTLFLRVRQLLPSHVVCLKPGQRPIEFRYANLSYCPSSTLPEIENIVKSVDDSLDQYFARLRKRHSRVGVLFSGGVDSSLILAKARNHQFERLTAIIARFPNHPNPELARAIEIAQHLKVELIVLDVTDDMIGELLPDLILALERPPAYLNTFIRYMLLRKLAPDFEIALTGEGADGMFGGGSAGADAQVYLKKQHLFSLLPTPIRSLLDNLTMKRGDLLSRKVQYYLYNDARHYIREKICYEPKYPDNKPRDQFVSSDVLPRLSAVRAARARPLYEIYEPPSDGSLFAICQNRGLYIQNRNQMYCYNALGEALFIRVGYPFLSKEIARIGFTLSDDLKMDERGTKPVLKRLACHFLPEEWVYASKLGFPTPEVAWMAGPLSNWWNRLINREKDMHAIEFKNLSNLKASRDTQLMWTILGLALFFQLFGSEGTE